MALLAKFKFILNVIYLPPEGRGLGVRIVRVITAATGNENIHLSVYGK